MNRTPVIVLRRQQRLGAFTVIELLIAVVIIAVLMVISFQGARNILRREKINSIALALAGYVEEVRNLSLKKVGSISAYSSNSSLKPCSISFVSSAAGNSLPAASVIASVSADTVDRSPAGLSINCAPRGNGTTTGLTGATDDGSFRVPYGLGSPVTVSVIQSGLSPSQQAKVTFTPRGLWAPALTSQTGDLIIKLLLENGGPMRCIRITDGLGFVDIGKSNSSSINATCDDYTRF